MARIGEVLNGRLGENPVVKLLISGLWLLWMPLSLAAGTDAYPKYDEIVSWIDGFVAANPRLATKEFVGFSTESRPIWLLRIAEDRSSAKPQVFFNAAHHGDEVVTATAVMSLAEYLAQNAEDPAVKRALRVFDVLIQPVVNPDGYQLRMRHNIEGVDLNRDYPLPGQLDRPYYRAKESRLLNRILQERDVYALVSVHSGIEAVLWPLCYTREKPAENEIFAWLATRSARAMGVSKAMQSFYDYPSTGELIDHAYLNYGTLALTFEISDQLAPEKSELPSLNRKTINGSMQILSDLVTLAE